jgi:hypothetical protein
MSFLDKLKNKYDAKMIIGSPLRVDFFNLCAVSLRPLGR